MNLYDKAIDNLTYGEINTHRRLQIIKALERAKKVEELLDLFKHLSVVNYNMAITQGSENYYENKRTILIKKIKVLEEELK